MKKHTIYEFPLGKAAEPRLNVRINRDDGLLAAVGSPAVKGRAAGRLLAAVSADAGDVVISTDGQSIHATVANSSSALPVKICDMDHAAVSAVNVPGGVIVTTGSAGDNGQLINVDSATGEASALLPVDREGAPRAVRVDDSPATALIQSMKLKGVYTSRSKELDPSDIAMLTSAYADAYEAVSGAAAARHRFIQPVIVRIVARDSRGCVVYRSCPVMIAPDNGPQCTFVDRTLSDAGFAVTEATKLSATPFSIGLEFPDGDFPGWRQRVATIEVEVSPQIHPLDFAGKSQASFTSFTATTATLRVSAPGMALPSAPVAGDGTEYRRRVEGTLCRLDSLMIPAWSVNAGAVSASETVNGIYAAATADCRRQLSTLLSAIAKRPDTADADTQALVSLSYPHSFGAETAAVNGDAMLWGGLTARLFDGYPVTEYATSAEKRLSGTTACTAVATMDDGRRLVTSTTLQKLLPDRFSPLLTYPHPRARELTVMVGMKSFTVTLRPSPDHRMAYALSADCRPFSADTAMDMHVIPAADLILESYPEAVVLSSAGDPYALRAICRCGAGDVKAVTAAARANSSIDFGRRRFYAFTTQGICSVAADASLNSLTATLIDPRPVASHLAVCGVDDSVAAVAGRDLVTVKGNAVKTVMRDCGACMPGWNATASELWLAPPSGGSIIVIDMLTDDHYFRDDVDPVSMLSVAGKLLMACDDGKILDAADERPSLRTISLTFRSALPKARSINGVCVRLFGGKIDGTVSFTADNGNSRLAYRLVDFRINGSLDRPLEGRVYSHPFRYVTLRINATVSADTRLHRALFTVKK